MKCEIVNEMRPILPTLGYSANTVVMSCRTHGIQLNGMWPVKDDLCPIARLDRLEKLCGLS